MEAISCPDASVWNYINIIFLCLSNFVLKGNPCAVWIVFAGNISTWLSVVVWEAPHLWSILDGVQGAVIVSNRWLGLDKKSSLAEGELIMVPAESLVILYFIC